MKKHLITLFALMALVGTLAAQAPKGFNYQMVVRNNAGQLVANKNVSVRLNIVQGSATGTSVYQMNDTYTTNANGLVTLVVGAGSPTYAAIDWGNGPYYIVSEVDPDGGSNYSLSTTQQILAVPYAEHSQHAAVADSVSGASEIDPKFVSWGYVYDSLVGAPDRLSQFLNDLNFLTASDLLLTLNGDTLCINGTSCVVLPKTTKIDWDSVINAPTNLSQFINDIRIDWDSVTNSPTNLSQFINDIRIDWDSVTNSPTNLSQFINDIRIDWDSVTNSPTNLSQFNNDLNISFCGDTLNIGGTTVVLPNTTWDSIINRPTNLSQFNNDLNLEWDSVLNHPTNLSQFNNDLNLEWDSVLNHPTNLSQFNNDLNLEWDSVLNHPTNLSQFNNDLNLEWDSVLNRPTNLSQFNNNITIHWDSIIGRPDSLSQFVNDLAPNLTETQNIYDVLQRGNDAQGLRIIGLGTPVDSNDVANKRYVDSLAALDNNRIDSLLAAHNGLANDISDSLDSINSAIAGLGNDITSLTGDIANLGNDLADSIADLRNELNDSIAELRDLIDSLNARIDSLSAALFAQQHELIDGELPGIFSVSSTKKIRFSKGNLQYRPRIKTWRFAANQWESIGSTNINITMGTYCNYWLDLFGYGTSGWDGGAAAYQPYEWNVTNSVYTESTDGDDLTGMYANADWGYYNPIINGGNQTGLWRTLTYNEWSHLLVDRPNAANLRGCATVAGVCGYLILPDNWTTPAGITFTTGVENDYTINSYSSTQWSQMEAAGAVFLPTSGHRNGTTTTGFGNEGSYWTSTHINGDNSFSVTVKAASSGAGAVTVNTDASQGCSVRLVRDYK